MERGSCGWYNDPSTPAGIPCHMTSCFYEAVKLILGCSQFTMNLFSFWHTLGNVDLWNSSTTNGTEVVKQPIHIYF